MFRTTLRCAVCFGVLALAIEAGPASAQVKVVNADGSPTTVSKAPAESVAKRPTDLTVRLPAAMQIDRDHSYQLTATWSEDGTTRTVDRTLVIRGGQTVQVDLRRPEDWPMSSDDLSGAKEFRLVNNASRRVTVGLRSGGRGKDFSARANSTTTVNVPSGAYEIVFQFADEPDVTYEGDRFTIQSGVAGVQISFNAGFGNYSIRRKGWASPMLEPVPKPVAF